MEAYEISVVMPCLNEINTLSLCIKEAQQAIEKMGIRGEIVIADNGSTDGSIETAKRLGARVIEVEKKGYGSALAAGIAAARGKYILMGDSDFSYNFAELPRFIAQLRAGADMVVGCRFPRCGGTIIKGAMPWKHQWIGNPVLSGLGKLFFPSPVDDFHCGLRAFHRQTILDLKLCTSGMEFASEMIIKATLQKLRVKQVPITLRPDKRNRAPHLRSWRDGWRHLRFMLMYTPTWLFIIPGLILSLLGLIGTILLLPRAVVWGSITFDLNTLLIFNGFLISGFQILSLGIFTKVYAESSGFLPDTGWLKLSNRYIIEIGAIVGAVLFCFGVYLILNTTMQWQSSQFGQLSYQDSLRQIIPAITCIILGLHFFFSGFVLAILGIKSACRKA